MDYWSLTLPRVIQGFALGFIFVPLSTLTLATIRRDKLVNATSAYNVLRNLGAAWASRSPPPISPSAASSTSTTW